MIHDRLRALRKARGLSQEALAVELHESQNTISNIETGKQKSIHPQLLYKIANFFHVELYELLSDNKAIGKSVNQQQTSNQAGIELINVLRDQLKAKDKQLDEKDRQILKLLELLELNSKIIYFT